ncbi:MAG TPA: lytic transglycosylase domain-containing protein [Bacillota bacterium]
MPSKYFVKRNRKSRPNFLWRWLAPIIKLVLSPIVLIWDSFRNQRLVDHSWLYAFFLLTSAVLSVAFLAIWITDSPVDQTLKMLSTIKSHSLPLEGDVDPLIHQINQVGLKYDIDPNLIFAVIAKESNFNPKAVSRAGARGLMQLTPFVWQEYSGSACTGTHTNRVICKKNSCIFDPEANIRVGTKYLRILIDHYRGRIDLALEAYNAGLTNVVPGRQAKFSETRQYVKSVFLEWYNLRKTVIALKLEAALYFRKGIRQLLGGAFVCWLILFWWANRKLFSDQF